MTQRPELLRQPDRFPLRPGSVTLGDNHDLSAQLRHIGERIADHDGRRQRLAFVLKTLGLADQVPVAAGAGDQFVAADQGGNGHAGNDRGQPPVDDIQQQPGRTHSGVSEVHMRIGG
jgi:hypothetical protein